MTILDSDDSVIDHETVVRLAREAGFTELAINFADNLRDLQRFAELVVAPLHDTISEQSREILALRRLVLETPEPVKYVDDIVRGLGA